METKKISNLQKITDSFIWLILMGLMTFSITYMIIYALTFAYSPIKLAVVTLVILSILSIVFLNKYTTGITLSLLLVSLAAGSIYLHKEDMLEVVFNSLISKTITFSQWALRCIQGYPVVSSSYINYFTILLCAMISGLVYFFTVKKFRFSILFIGGAFVFILEVVQKKAISDLALYLFIFTSLVYFFRSRYFFLKKQLDENDFDTYKSFMKMSICLGLGICIGTMVLSYKYPYKAEWIHNIVEKITRQEYYYEAEDFSVKSAGLQADDGILGGDISPNDAIVLEVNTPLPIYLKASSRDTYTGNAWIREEEEAVPINLEEKTLEDTMEALQTFEWIRGKDDSLEMMFFKQTAEIRFVNISTKSLFIPSKIEKFNIISNRQREVFLTGDDMLSLENSASKNFTYVTEFYEPRVALDQFKEILRKSKKGYYKEIAKNNLYNAVKGEIDRWADRAEAISAKYTQLPEDLPERIAELAYTITEEQDTNYDKVKALEEYLGANYGYTLKPGLPSEDKDFVDEFLFENKQGYCTYFASALAVLTRSIGLPSRYVEGYSLPSRSDTDKSAYVVTNKRAHAWVEVYFEGVGWIVFEATPPYRQAEGVSQAGMSMEEAMRNEQYGYTQSNNVAIFNQNETMTQTYALFIISSVVILLGLVILYVLRKYKFEKMEPRAAVLFLYNYYLRMLVSCNLEILNGETETVFAARIDDQMIFLESNFKEITKLFLVARYSQLAISEEEKKKMMNFRHTLLKAVKRRVNILVHINWNIKNNLF